LSPCDPERLSDRGRGLALASGRGAANSAGESQPLPGTLDWERWQVLVKQAIADNAAYLAALKVVPTHDGPSSDR
jgi:hypothetical protein